MMVSLFSVFDPSVGGLQLNWVVLGMIFMLFVNKYYLWNWEVKKMGFVGVYKGFMEIAHPFGFGVSSLVMGIFMFIMMSNVIGLFPFIFTSTAHLFITLGMGLVMWIGFVFMGWGKNFVHSMAHLVPEGSPLLLAPILVVIESVSHLIRPFTLSVRLAANMMAGHLIMGLISSISMLSGGFLVSVILQMLLLMLEIGVAFIQGFVFSILVILYILEYY